MKVRCLKGTALVEMLDEKPISDGGIFMANPIQKKPTQAKVIGIGPPITTKRGRILWPEFAIGDTVLTNHHYGKPLKVSNRRYKFVNHSDIVARIECPAP